LAWCNIGKQFKGPVIIYGRGWHRREMFFVAKILLTQPLKSQKIWLPNFIYQLKNKYPPLAKNLTKGFHSLFPIFISQGYIYILYILDIYFRNKIRISFSCHICPLPFLWHEFDNGLWNFLQFKVSCSLHMYFRWKNYLSRNKSENDQDSDSDWFTYCIDIWRPTLGWYRLKSQVEIDQRSLKPPKITQAHI
jgi:hypothetical protein